MGCHKLVMFPEYEKWSGKHDLDVSLSPSPPSLEEHLAYSQVLALLLAPDHAGVMSAEVQSPILPAIYSANLSVNLFASACRPSTYGGVWQCKTCLKSVAMRAHQMLCDMACFGSNDDLGELRFRRHDDTLSSTPDILI
jgi:hypothetical protein